MADAKIGCIVVFYSPELAIVNRWTNFAHANPDITFIFVDNTPSALSNPEVRNAIKKTPHHIILGQNLGIATAQNRGIERLKELGCNYLIFFDQDSNPTAELIRNLYHAFINESIYRKVGAIGPRVINSSNPDERFNEGIEEADKIISSGTLTSVPVLNDVGLMEESLFIDCVDHEWCWRAQSKGYKILRDNSLQLHHKIGVANVKCMGQQLHLTSPTRYYYIYRNSRRMIMRNYVPMRWKIHTMRSLARHLMLIPFCKAFKGQKRASIANALRGLLSM